MKRKAQHALSRDRRRRMKKLESSSIPSTTQNYPIQPTKSDTTIEDCLAELESSIPLDPDVQTTTSQESLSTNSRTAGPSLSDGSKHCCHLNADLMRDKVEFWNQSYSQWDKHKPPPAVLLPSFDVEMTRHFKLQELSTFLLEASMVTDASGVKRAGLKMPSFERWLLDAKLEDQSSLDPILPRDVSMGTKASQRLMEEMVAMHHSRAEASKIVKNLCWRSNQIVAFLQKQQQTDRRYLWKKGDQVDVELSSERSQEKSALITLVYRRPKQWKKPFCIKINRSHYDKLKTLFYRTHRLEASPRLDRIYHLLVMLLLLRYSSLSGGHLLKELRGGGMQGAVHESVFDVLGSTTSKHVIEGFGSPFNCFLSEFGSAFFNDLDWHFGSIGNFFQLPFAQEASRHRHGLLVQANPPFAPGIMAAMSKHIMEQVESANVAKVSLTFVVIVPSPGDPNDPDRAVAKRRGGEAIQILLDADSHHIVLDAKEHGYIEGAQHLRPTRYKESLYDTSVIIISSTNAPKEMDIGSLEQKVREAFRSKHQAETDARRSSADTDEIDDSTT